MLQGIVSRRRGFTLLELLVVVAILAIIAGGLIASYDGLAEKSAQGVATYTIGALNSSIRTYRATNNNQYPSEFDSLMFSSSGDGTDGAPLNLLNATIIGKLGSHTLTAAGASALNNAGITTVRYVSGSYDNSALPTGTQPAIPNRIFDSPTRGSGVLAPITAGMVLPVVEGIGINDFGGGTNTVSSRAQDIAGLDQSLCHVLVVVGIGNNSTLVQSTDGRTDARAAGLAEAPYYKKVAPNLYSRYLAVFHLGTSTDGTLANVQYFSSARFVGVLDTNGDWYDEEEAEYTGTKI